MMIRPSFIFLTTLSVALATAWTVPNAEAASKPTYARKMEIGNLLFFNGDIDRAINAFQMAGELNPKAFEPHLNLINLYMQKNTPESLEKAGEECREVIKRKPGNREVHLILGNIIRNAASSEKDPEVAKKKLQEALHEVEEAEKLGAPEAMSENTIGLIELQMGEGDKALEHIENAIKKQSNFPDAHLVKAVLLFKTLQGKPGETPALPDFKSPEVQKKMETVLHELDVAADQKNGMNPEAHNTKADIQFAMGKLDEASKCYRKAAEQEPKYAQAWAGLGNCEAQLAAQETDESKKQEHIKAAREGYEKAKKLKPDDKNIVYGLAIMLEKMGQTQDAIQEFHEGLMMETDPLMKAQIQMHVQQLMGGSFGNFGQINGVGASNPGGIGNGIFAPGALSQPFSNLIKIKPPAGREAPAPAAKEASAPAAKDTKE